MKIKHKLLCALLSCSLVMTYFPASISHAEIVAHNQQWESTEWTLDDNGVLTIFGTGNMQEYLTYHEKYSRNGQIPSWLYNSLGEQIKTVIISDGITNIGSWAFRNCKNLIDVQIPNSVTRIGDYAFDGCEQLEKLTLPDSVVEIGDGAFYKCNNLADINVPKNIELVGEDAFTSCKKLNSLPIPDSQRSLNPAKSNNRDANLYDIYHAETVKSYLYADEDKIYRVECIGGLIVVETYSNDLQLLSSRNLESDLVALWGGFFAGKDYNFIITGRANPDENKNVAVVTVTKYDKNWNKLGQAVLNDANTTLPFRAGSLRCDESNGVLYLHTCHQMYATEDGLNHQANMTISVKENDMSIIDAQYKITLDYGYVSHSFNQFILIDKDRNIVALDQGDAYPRALIMQRYKKKAGNGKFAGQLDKIEVIKFPENKEMYQKTGVSVGGFAETTKNYVTVYSDDENGGQDNLPRNIFISTVSKSKFSSSNVHTVKITDYVDKSAGTPILIPTGFDEGYILWNIQSKNDGGYISTEKLAYVKYSDGKISEIVEDDGMISDCQPIVYQGKIIWYVTENSSPTFYLLDSTGITKLN